MGHSAEDIIPEKKLLQIGAAINSSRKALSNRIPISL
jgi:hypothetical protein